MWKMWLLGHRMGYTQMQKAIARSQTSFAK